jgi:mannosidase alpha-like ER degradation enhancer 2
VLSDSFGSSYDGFLLRKAAQLGKALAKAFISPTGIPHGSLNLRGGVVAGESNLTATATAGTLLLEFATLSRLTSTPTYTSLAHTALAAVLYHRSGHGLMGSHIDITNGVWGHRTSSLGSGSDSLYEYLLKASLLLGSTAPIDLIATFDEVRAAIKRHLYRRPWYKDVDYETLALNLPVLDALQAFWPGVELLSGHHLEALDTLMAFAGVWQLHGCLPEGYNIVEGRVLDSRPSSPLRPEVVESAL